ncbi:MAG: phosphotransferase [Dehalococcoidia bacterium]
MWEAVLPAFGLGRLVGRPRPVTGGWVNRVWCVEATNGLFAVKEMADSHKADWTVQFQQALRLELTAWDSGMVPMAEPVRTVTGDAIVDLPGSQSGPRLHRCHRWVTGEPCLEVQLGLDDARSVGRSVAAVLNLRLGAGSSLEAFQSPGLDSFEATLDEAIGVGKAWARSLEGLTPGVNELRHELAALRGAAVPLLLCHRDLDPKNTTRRPDGELSIQDWDYAGPMLPSAELLGVALSFAGGPERPDDALVSAVLDSYRRASGHDLSFAHAATPLLSEGFNWLMFNVWLGLGHRTPPLPGGDRRMAWCRSSSSPGPASRTLRGDGPTG